MITADQLVAHAVGDYILQSHWMATEKTKQDFACACHAAIYSIPFFFIGSYRAYVVIMLTHYLVDRYRLARVVVWLKNNGLQPGDQPTIPLTDTGYPSETPAWLAVWLLIVADNVIHVLINGLAIRYLP